MRPLIALFMAAVLAAPLTAEAASAKVRHAAAPQRPPTVATEPQIIADLIRACPNEVLGDPE